MMLVLHIIHSEVALTSSSFDIGYQHLLFATKFNVLQVTYSESFMQGDSMSQTWVEKFLDTTITYHIEVHFAKAHNTSSFKVLEKM